MEEISRLCEGILGWQEGNSENWWYALGCLHGEAATELQHNSTYLAFAVDDMIDEVNGLIRVTSTRLCAASSSKTACLAVGQIFSEWPQRIK